MAGLFRIGRGGGVTAAAMLAAVPSAGWCATAKLPHATHKAGAVPGAKRPAAGPEADGAAIEPVRSAAASRVMAWIAAAHDNGSLPFIVIDKQAASLSLFNRDGAFLGEAPVLIGAGVGDDSSPGVGAKTLAEIGPAERTTPAGRFVAKFGKAFGHTRVLWVDYADSVALHAVITTNKQEHRVERLLSPEVDDNRITFGCINVGTSFYTRRIRPLFAKAGGLVYILPDTKALDDVFPRVRLLPYLGSDRPEQHD